MVPPAGMGAEQWLALLTHVKRWVTNLLRAKSQRRAQSVGALRAVIKAVRRTTVYVRSLKEGGRRVHAVESELSLLWTDLAFSLQDIGLNTLAKRCSISGQYWADPGQFEPEFLESAGVRLTDIERLAKLNLKALE